MLFDIADRLQISSGLLPSLLMLRPSFWVLQCAPENSLELAEMLGKLSAPWTKLLWGPRGAGKTYSLAELCGILLESSFEERILVVAPSNVAVDTAMIEILEAFQRRPALEHLLTERRVVRFGYPRDERILAHPELFGPVDRELLSEEVAALHRKIRAMKESQAPEEQIAIARAELHQLQEQIKERLTTHLSNARLATTVASAFTGQNLLAKAGAWGTVAADEASMINAAIVLELASIAKERLLLVGDPRQLAPIFEWQRGSAPDKVEHWLGKDPYEFSTISIGSGWDKKIRTDDSRMVRVLSQRRCHPRIWSLVESLLSNLFASGVSIGELESIASVPPLPVEPAVLMDVSSTGVAAQDDLEKKSSDDLAQRYLSACRKTRRTWENPPTAWLAIDLAAKSAPMLLACASPSLPLTEVRLGLLVDGFMRRSKLILGCKGSKLGRFTRSKAVRRMP